MTARTRAAAGTAARRLSVTTMRKGMRMGMIMTGLLAVLPALHAQAQGATGTCPEPKLAQPTYPLEALRAARQGAAVVEVRTDGCGRVLEARLKTRTRHADLNEAALDAARRSILSPDKRAEAVDGWVSWPIEFSVDSSLVSKPVAWPRTHRSARFVVDAPLEGEADVATLKAGMREMEEGVVRPPVLPLRHVFRQVQGEQGIEFWLFIADGDHTDRLAMRYRPVIEEDVPVVRMAMRCEFPEADCASFQKILVERGLPMAKRLE